MEAPKQNHSSKPNPEKGKLFVEKQRKQINPFIRFSGLALQMGITIYLGSLLGNYFDENYESSDELYTKICTLVAVFISIVSVIYQVTRFQR